MIIQRGIVRTDFIACLVNHKTQPFLSFHKGYKLDDLSNVKSEEISADEEDFDKTEEIEYQIFIVFDDGHSITLLLSLGIRIKEILTKYILKGLMKYVSENSFIF